MDTLGAAGGGVTQPGIFVDAGNNTVIDQKPIFRAHQTVATFANLQVRHHVGIHHVHKATGISAFDDQFAKGRGIQQTQIFAGVGDFARHRLFNGFI